MKGIKRLSVYTLLLLFVCILCLVGCHEGPDPATCQHVYGEWTQGTVTSCTAPVQKSRTCTLCNAVEMTSSAPLGHTAGEWTFVIPADCETEGKETSACTRCGEALEHITEATGHTICEYVPKDPTCTEVGWKTYIVCENEGCDYRVYEELPILPHDKELHKQKAPTCIEEGWLDYVTCRNCDYTTYEEIPLDPNAHLLKYFDGQDPSCTEDGWMPYTRCALCFTSDKQTIPAHGHVYDGPADAACNACSFVRDVNCTHGNTEPVLGYAPTCTATGLTDGLKCVDCGELLTKQESIPATGHDEVPHAGKSPTCTEGGYNAYVTCKHCAYTTYESLPATGHDEVTHNAKAPTCTEGGHDAYVTCKNCDYTTYKALPAAGHTYDNDQDATCNACGEIRDVTCKHTSKTPLAGKEATCTETGLTAGEKCTACGEILTAQETIPAKGHTYDNDRDADCNICGDVRDVSCKHTNKETLGGKDATCTEEGMTAGEKCADCGETLTVQETIPAKGHTDTSHEAKAPACTEIGWDAYAVCSVCNRSTYKEKSALGHDYATAWSRDANYHYHACSRCTARGDEAKHTYNAANICTTCSYQATVYNREGNTVYFGSYPQRDVTSSHQSTLNALTGALPTKENAGTWTSYRYCDANGAQADYMWYQDVSYNGETYRGVYFVEHRPNSVTNPTETNYQGQNEYYTGRTYWFKFEPIAWTVLSEEGSTVTLLCNMALDAREFDGTTTDYTRSAIRTWLNETFYETAFNDLQKELIQKTAVETVNDKVFLLGYDDLKNADYGFDQSAYNADAARRRMPTAYAKAQGAFVCRGNSFRNCSGCGYAWWYLRDADETYINRVYGSDSHGYSAYASTITDTSNGIVPAIVVRWHAHPDVYHEAKEPTCTEVGWDAYTSCATCSYSSRVEKPALGHEEINHAAREGNCFNVGWNAYVTCARCDHTTYAEKSTVPHQYTGGKCSVCGISEKLYTREGNKVYFGWYPQTRYTSSTTYTVQQLNELAGTLPTAEDSGTWTSYGYYQSGEVEHYMWYQDIAYEGNTYRGVYFTVARPEWTIYNSDSYQSVNGYYTKYIYWFKFEPISWTVLDQSGHTATLLCDMILDAQAFQNEMYKGTDNFWYTASNGAPAGTFAGEYEYSTIRAWLNDTFYNTAFNELEKALILTSAVDNSLVSTGYGEDSDAKYCVGGITQDKVYLLSRADMLNIAYGYRESAWDYDTLRQKKTTDYAKSQGLDVDLSGYGNWWSRSPMGRDNTGVHCGSSGNVGGLLHSLYSTSYGVVPVVRITLTETCAHTNKTLTTLKAPTCTAIGAQYYTCNDCGVILDRVQLPALGHDLTHYEAMPATCYVGGWDAYDACGRSGCYYTTKKAVAAGHKMVDGVCTVCNNGKYVSVGDSVTLGKYEQDNNTKNGKEAIEWIVIATEGNKALVISRYALDYMGLEDKFADPFSNDYWWGNSYMRTFLNSEVYASFTEEEKKMILLSTLENKPYDDPYTPYKDETATWPTRANTEDYVFLLSVKEFVEYGVNAPLKLSEYAYKKSKLDGYGYDEDDIADLYWYLRHQGWYAVPHVYGQSWSYGATADYPWFIRPAMWIDVSELPVE